MRKSILLSAILLLILNHGESSGRDLELSIKSFNCIEEGVKISYSIKNEKNFPRPNIRVGFKILIDDKPVGCKVVKIDVPVSEDEQILEAIVPAPCEDKSYKLVTAVFGSSTKKYKIDNWLAECPR